MTMLIEKYNSCVQDSLDAVVAEAEVWFGAQAPGSELQRPASSQRGNQDPRMGLYNTFFSSPAYVFTVAILFRVVLLFYGRWQDANSPFKYTDIDYLVFTDAARFVAHGRSPYDRATYRYTPLLAWLLLPTTFGGLWFEFGKALFAAGDVVTGWLILLVLRSRGMDTTRAMKFASIWLLNPMVANISTRGSSEGLLAVIVVALLWAVTQRRWVLAGALLGLGVHFKIYPFIYASSIFWALGPDVIGSWVGQGQSKHTPRYLQAFNKARQLVTASSFISFCALSLWMLLLYHVPFVEHTFLYHFTRIDHRHNFSIYNTLLHLNSAQGVDGLKIESLAFIPQLLLSVVVIPLCLAKKDLASTMLAQTFAFVTFNKVCTSQVSESVALIDFGLTQTVFPVVHGVLAVLPAELLHAREALAWRDCTFVVDRRSSGLASTRV
nr:gpi mannosyltransferase 1 [Quercus suber]